MSAATHAGIAEICTQAADDADAIAIRILETIEADDPDHVRWSKLKAADDVMQTAARFRARAEPETPA